MKRRNKQPDLEAIAKAVVAEMTKAPQIVPGLGTLMRGTQTSDMTGQARSIAEGVAQWATVPFGPGIPIPPSSIDPREPTTGSPAPRFSEFPVSINNQIAAQRRNTPFEVLRLAADRVDVMRRCIEARKSHLLSLDWDITLSKSAIKRIMTEDNVPTLGKAFQVAREKFEPDMARLRDWWTKPDAPNGLDFASWLGMLLEEQLVIDAVSIYPHYKLNGTLQSLELIDGATIKPLRDRRGGTPVAPLPAFQQIVYGFPRGDFQASNSDEVTGQYHTAQLLYRPRHRRSFTPYGFPEVEHALSAVDLWLKTIGWLRSEFDDGTTPDTWMQTDLNAAGPASMSPDMLRQWETLFNQMLAGNFEERRKVHLLPKGFEPKEMRSFQDKFKPDLFEMLVKIICMCFSVMPTEIGFPPSSGIGGKGHQEGEANSAYRKDIRPSVTWLQGLMTEISRSWLGMPAELQFTFIGYETEDQTEAESVSDARVKSGRTTLNEERADKGLPLYEFDEADTPFVQTSTGLIFLPGELQRQQDANAATAAIAALPADPPPPDDGPPVDPTAPEPVDGDPAGGDPAPEPKAVPEGHVRVREHTRPKGQRKPATPAAATEAAKFATFARKRTGRTWRDFAFEHLDVDVGKALNAAGASGDTDRIKTLVGDVGKALPGG